MGAAMRSKIITKRSGSTPSSPPCQNYYYYYYRSFQLATTTAIYFLLNLEEHFHIPDMIAGRYIEYVENDVDVDDVDEVYYMPQVTQTVSRTSLSTEDISM